MDGVFVGLPWPVAGGRGGEMILGLLLLFAAIFFILAMVGLFVKALFWLFLVSLVGCVVMGLSATVTVLRTKR